MNTYAKLENGKLVYPTYPMEVVIRHHDEWDEPVIDADGNETGETTHQTNDWDERKWLYHPTEEEANGAGWKLVVETKPNPPEGQHAVSSHLEEQDGRIVRVWEYAPDEPKVRVFKVCELFWWIAQKGLAAELDALLESQGMYSAAITQVTVSDDDPNFTGVLAAVQDALELTDKEVDECLCAAEVGA